MCRLYIHTHTHTHRGRMEQWRAHSHRRACTRERRRRRYTGCLRITGQVRFPEVAREAPGSILVRENVLIADLILRAVTVQLTRHTQLEIDRTLLRNNLRSKEFGTSLAIQTLLSRDFCI